uniref:(northern house mosquito) hypothetical protein n=1 Tax=Culex pipiens TaxID=7175 RepID=A0A8D8BVB4_CULPI
MVPRRLHQRNGEGGQTHQALLLPAMQGGRSHAADGVQARAGAGSYAESRGEETAEKDQGEGRVEQVGQTMRSVRGLQGAKLWQLRRLSGAAREWPQAALRDARLHKHGKQEEGS